MSDKVPHPSRWGPRKERHSAEVRQPSDGVKLSTSYPQGSTDLGRDPTAVGDVERQASMFTANFVTRCIGWWVVFRNDMHLRLNQSPIFGEINTRKLVIIKATTYLSAIV